MAEERSSDSREVAPSDGGSRSAASAAAIPLLAVGLLAAAVWFGSKPASEVAAPVPPEAASTPATTDPLPSWNEGSVKRAILDFVKTVTTEGTPGFVPVAERVAVFDNDGTLVCEKPLVHGMFLIDRIKALVERQPDLAHEEPYATILTGDLEFIRRLGRKFFIDVTFAALAGVPAEAIEAEVRDFLRTSRHPLYDVPLGEVTYLPMKELLALLQSRGFAVWICSGSGIHFMRPAAEAWYGIPPERVIASRPVTELREVSPAGPETSASPNKRLDLVVRPEILVLNDGAQKPVSIGDAIGRRPIFAAGNVGSAGDIDMLRWSQAGDRPSLQLLVLHDDADREVAYGEPSNASLEAAETYGWPVVRMARDWRQLFARPLTRRPAAGAAHGPGTAAPPQAAASGQSVVSNRWDDELAAYAKQDREAPAAAGGICLLGSSNIRMWNTLADDFPGMNVVNRGVGGCLLGELADFAARLVANVKPRVIVVAAGTNDVAGGRSTADILAAFKRLVANLQTATPEATIVFLAISPTVKRWDQLERQQAANAAIKEFIEAEGREEKLVYLDVNAAFLGPDGTPAPECFLDDMQHPSTIGNARRAELMRPVLRTLVSSSESPPEGGSR